MGAGTSSFENTFGNTAPGNMGADFEMSSSDDLPFQYVKEGKNLKWQTKNKIKEIIKIRKQRKKVCLLCSDKNFELDYKNLEQLKKFVNDKGKILPRRTTGACAKHQRDITTAVKRARHIAILPYSQN